VEIRVRQKETANPLITEILIESNQEVMGTLEHKLQELNISRGAIVSIIGAVDSCCISNMPKTNAKEDILTEYSEPFELSGTGEIIEGKPHIHCVLGREGNVALSGHLHWAKVVNWYVRIYVMAIA
jgi:uncharacterized protein